MQRGRLAACWGVALWVLYLALCFLAKVSFDSTKHLSDASIKKRPLERQKLQELEQQREEQKRREKEAEERQRAEERWATRTHRAHLGSRCPPLTRVCACLHHVCAQVCVHVHVHVCLCVSMCTRVHGCWELGSKCLCLVTPPGSVPAGPGPGWAPQSMSPCGPPTPHAPRLPCESMWVQLCRQDRWESRWRRLSLVTPAAADRPSGCRPLLPAAEALGG